MPIVLEPTEEPELVAPSIILDPSEVAVTGRIELPLIGGISVMDEGIDWGTQEVKAFLAEAQFGSKMIDHAWPARLIKLPLFIESHGSETFDQIRIKLESWVGLVNEEQGGWLKRNLPSGTHVFADIVEAKLHLTSDALTERRSFDHSATLELTALPDFYGPAITGTAHEGTGDLAYTMQVLGELPARVVEQVVEDKSGNAQLGMMWHYRRRNYSSASTAEWAYNAEALGLLDLAEKTTVSGSYGTKVVTHPKLSTGWTPVLSTNLAGTTFLTHKGLYNVWARIYSTSTDLPWLRLVYGVGDIVAPQENKQVQVPGVGAYFEVNVGQVNISALPFGAQRWEGVIQARGELGGENISIDRLWFQCADECSGVLEALTSTVSLTNTVAADPLTGTGALSGSEANRGGKWEESGGTEGFTRGAEGAKREHVSDSEGRTALLAGSTVGPALVSVEQERSAAAVGLTRGVYLRYFSSTYFVRVAVKVTSILFGIPTGIVELEYDAGSGVVPVTLTTISGAGSTFVSLEAELNAAGEVVVRYGGAAYRYTLPATFKKGETHAEGKVGTYDYNPSSTAVVRTYRNFQASALPTQDAVIYPSKAAYLSTNGMYRESADGLGAGPIGHPGSDLPRLPVSGPEEAPVEIAVKPSRGQFGEVADSGKDAFKVQITYRPCYASIPEA